jgi:hypothetical protein
MEPQAPAGPADSPIAEAPDERGAAWYEERRTLRRGLWWTGVGWAIFIPIAVGLAVFADQPPERFALVSRVMVVVGIAMMSLGPLEGRARRAFYVALMAAFVLLGVQLGALASDDNPLAALGGDVIPALLLGIAFGGTWATTTDDLERPARSFRAFRRWSFVQLITFVALMAAAALAVFPEMYLESSGVIEYEGDGDALDGPAALMGAWVLSTVGASLKMIWAIHRWRVALRAPR